MDIFDRAQETDARFRAMSIDAALSRSQTGPSAESCGWCGEEIPQGRREAVPGCELCASCQGQKERLKEQR